MKSPSQDQLVKVKKMVKFAFSQIVNYVKDCVILKNYIHAASTSTCYFSNIYCTSHWSGFLYCLQSMPAIEEEVEEEVEVESSEQSVLSADNQEEKALDLSSTSSAEQEVSVPALLAVIGRNNPEASQIQDEVELHSVLNLLLSLLFKQTFNFSVCNCTQKMIITLNGNKRLNLDVKTR